MVGQAALKSRVLAQVTWFITTGVYKIVAVIQSWNLFSMSLMTKLILTLTTFNLTLTDLHDALTWPEPTLMKHNMTVTVK